MKSTHHRQAISEQVIRSCVPLAQLSLLKEVDGPSGSIGWLINFRGHPVPGQGPRESPDVKMSTSRYSIQLLYVTLLTSVTGKGFLRCQEETGRPRKVQMLTE